MSALTTDTRSIGQVLYEMIQQSHWVKWAGLNSVDRLTFGRAAEVLFKRGHDAGIEHQKLAAPTPRAKQYRDEAVDARARLANLRAVANVVALSLHNADQAAHTPCGRECAVHDAINDLQKAVEESKP